MSVDENKAIARRYFEELWNRGNLAALDELLTADFVIHYPLAPVPPGPEGAKAHTAPLLKGFPDARHTIEDLVAEGDRVAIRSRWTGTHQNEYRGIPSTGRRVTVNQMTVLRIVDGKIAERWAIPDVLGLMQQLGVVQLQGARPAESGLAGHDTPGLERT
jgi:steroid delta-isomerase-like uncharacterized protein